MKTINASKTNFNNLTCTIQHCKSAWNFIYTFTVLLEKNCLAKYQENNSFDIN